MQTVLLTLIGSTRRIDLKLPAEVPIGDLLLKMLELCEPRQAHFELSRWRLVLSGQGVVLPPTRSLSECGVVDGTHLLLQEYASFMAQQPQQAQSPSFQPRALPPSAGTGGIGVKWNLPNS